MLSTGGVGAGRDASGKWPSPGGLRATGVRASLTQSEPDRGSPGGLVARTPGFHRHGLSSIPAWGTEIPQGQPEKKKKSSEYFFSCLLAFFTPKEDLENELAFCTKEDEENFD